MYLSGIEYSFLSVLFPLLGYVWLISYGAKYVNNRYGFKKTSNGIIVYIKNRDSYSTLILIIIVVFLFLSIYRLVYEIRNELLLKKELRKGKN